MWKRKRSLETLDDDIRDHIEREVEELVARGKTPEAARRRALAAFGNVNLAKEDTRAIWSSRWLGELSRDARYALRQMRRNPGFAAAVVLTLGVGIGGTTAVFGVVDALFLRAPDGVSKPASVRRMFIGRDAGRMQSRDGAGGFWPDAQVARDESRAFAGAATYQLPKLVDLDRGASASRVRASVVSGPFFSVLGVVPVKGRLLGAADDGGGAPPVAVISHALWRARLGGTDDALGKALVINGRPLEVVGVAERGFSGLDADAVDVWLPAAAAIYAGIETDEGWRTTDSMSGSTRHVVRLHFPKDEERAAAEASAALARATPRDSGLDPTPQVFLRPIVLAAVRSQAWAIDLSLWLLIAAGLVLIISCANVANLLLARGVTRRREFALRMSLGAGGWRVARQQLTEGAVLAVLGGATGVALAYFGSALLQQFPLPPAATRLDGRLLTFALLLSILTAVMFGLLPAFRSIRVDPVSVLKGAAVRGGPSNHHARRLLVVVQVSLSFALLVGAALFVRSLAEVTGIRGGADLDQLLTVEVKSAGVLADGVQRVEALPGVERAALVSFPPFEGWGWSLFWRRQGEDQWVKKLTYLNLVGPNYFETAGTRLVRGRDIQQADTTDSVPVAVINEAMAHIVSETADALGQCVAIRPIQMTPVPCVRIVGVVESQRNSYLSPETVPMMFRPIAQTPEGIPHQSPMLLVRTAGDPAAHVVAVRSALQGLRPDLPYVNVAPLAERLRGALQPFRLGATLFAIFGLLALFLSAVGLQAVLGYFVAERTSEVGIRRALGAPATGVVWLVGRQSLVPVLIGLAIGFGAAVFGARAIESRLFGIGPHDPLSLAIAAACLIAVAIVATILPVWRAIRIDPMAALRAE